MRTLIEKTGILFISTYAPRKCGIASFTNDLVAAITPELSQDMTIEICALDKTNRLHLYDGSVKMIMDGHNLKNVLSRAVEINNDESIRLICIEHEFGLYGGELGEYLLGFLALLEKPFIIRFHTVLPAPAEKMLKVVQAIALLAERIIVMTHNSARLLRDDYHLGADQIIIIPYGTHAHSTADVFELKQKFALADKHVLTTFGLLTPNKGIEKGILAMKQISAAIPNAMYMVLGQTHPNLLEEEGEKYREFLQALIVDNNLQHHVKLVNEYLPKKMLMEYLALTDIYLFTSKDPNQAVSGTFLYAMSAGCPIISNKFVLATEMLDEKTGVILSGTDELELAEHAIRILRDPHQKKEMSNNAFLKTRDTTWEKVGQKHANLFHNILGTPIITPELSNQFVN